MNSIHFTFLPPPAALNPHVECFRIAEYIGDEALSIKVSPNAVPGLLFQHANGASIIDTIAHSGRQQVVPTFFLHGAGAFPSVMNFKRGTYVTTQVILKPHALYSLFGLNALELTDGQLEGRDLAAHDLSIRLMDATSHQQRIHLLTNFLLTKLDQAPPRDCLIEESLHLIHADIACVSVKYLRDYLNISERQFERRFFQSVGLSPQSYIRVKRFNAAVELIKAGSYARLTDIAHALNYYDQSHFIRDVIALSGLTPKRLSQQDDATYHPQVGYSYI